VQVLVVGFHDPTFSGEVLGELTRLEQAGVVRLVDVLLVSRAEDGTLAVLDPPAELGTGRGAIAAALLGGPQRAAPEEPEPAGWSLADAVLPGSVAAVALIEHVWAGPLRDAIQAAGGLPLEETWLAPEDLQLLEALLEGRSG
jgi:hypothetical protein